MPRTPPWLLPAMFCVGGLAMAHHPMLKDGLGWFQSDPGDTRFTQYVLEHGYRWLFQMKGHRDLWSPPFFFPTEGHLGWGENLLGAMPVFAAWRVLGAASDTAFQLWVLTVGALNFTAAYFFFRRCVNLDAFAASVGAVLFAFAGQRIGQSAQLLPQFFSVWAVHACWRLAVDGQDRTAEERTKWLGVFFAAVAGQIAAGLALGGVLLIGLAAAGALGLVFKEGRRRLGFVVAGHPFAIALMAVAALALLLPIITHRLAGRPLQDVAAVVPPLAAWFHWNPGSWWYGGAAHPIEQRLGYGVAAMGLCGFGVWTARADGTLKFLAVLLGGLIAGTAVWGAPWKFLGSPLPVVGVALLGLFGVALFVAVAIDWVRAQGKAFALAAVPLGLVAVLEQGETTTAFSKDQVRADLQDLSGQIGPECEAFFFSPIDGAGPASAYQLDAMGVSLARSIPTLNGHAARTPPGWALGEPAIRSPQDEQRNAQAAQAWLTQNRVIEKVCWAKVGRQEGPLRAQFVDQSVPARLVAGQRASATLRFRNTGEQAWSPEARFNLGSEAPRDNTTWSSNRVGLPQVVKPGEELMVTFDFVAPAAPGKYAFQWRMVQEQVAWFGSPSPLVEIEVTAP